MYLFLHLSLIHARAMNVSFNICEIKYINVEFFLIINVTQFI